MSFGKRKPKALVPDRRMVPRQRGEILTPGQPPRRCEVSDLSDQGAQITVASVFGIASKFELRVGARTYAARVVLREAGRLVVSFGPPVS